MSYQDFKISDFNSVNQKMDIFEYSLLATSYRLDYHHTELIHHLFAMELNKYITDVKLFDTDIDFVFVGKFVEPFLDYRKLRIVVRNQRLDIDKDWAKLSEDRNFIEQGYSICSFRDLYLGAFDFDKHTLNIGVCRALFNKGERIFSIDSHLFADMRILGDQFVTGNNLRILDFLLFDDLDIIEIYRRNCQGKDPMEFIKNRLELNPPTWREDYADPVKLYEYQ